MKRATLLLAAMLAALLLASGAALAGPLVEDTSTLTPPPPPGSECRDNGQYVICQTYFDETAVNEPVDWVELPCGTFYETSTTHREGIRWYSDGLIVKRFHTQDTEGTWSLSPTGEGPTIGFFSHENVQTDYAVPGDGSEDNASETHHGVFRVLLPGSGGLLTAGITYPDGTHHGVVHDIDADEDGIVDDPEVAATLCAALGDPLAESPR